VHARLLAASGDVGAACGLDGARSDVEPLFAALAVAHVVLALFEVVQLFPCGVVRRQGSETLAQVLEQRRAAVAAQDGAGGAEGFPHVLLREREPEEVPQVPAGVVEVTGEDDVRPGEGVADDVGDPVGAVADDLYPEAPGAEAAAEREAPEQRAERKTPARMPLPYHLF